MTDRAVFGRFYTSFTPAGTEVWLANGTSVSVSPVSTQDFTAGTNLIQGEAVYVSGTYVFPATAISGVSLTNATVVGLTSSSASTSSTVSVILDEVAVVSDANITAERFLTPGEYYYLSKYPGQVTKFITSSGNISASGNYQALTVVGQAVSSSELKIEIEPPLSIYT